MKQQKFLFAIATLLLITLACNALTPQTAPTIAPASAQPQYSGFPQTEADVPRIPVNEAKAAFDSGSAIFVDTRSVDAYAEKHIQGALSIPLDKFETNIANISIEKSQWVITYCT